VRIFQKLWLTLVDSLFFDKGVHKTDPFAFMRFAGR